MADWFNVFGARFFYASASYVGDVGALTTISAKWPNVKDPTLHYLIPLANIL